MTTLPGLGSIQLKAAWVPSKLLDGDPNTYHLTDAVYYKDSPSQPNGLCYDVEQFGLIGLHIIQRVHAGAPGGKPEPAGGTYIFATWEHQSIGNGAGYTYVNYSKFATNTELPFPNTAAGLPVARLKPYPLPTTQALDIQVQAGSAKLGVEKLSPDRHPIHGDGRRRRQRRSRFRLPPASLSTSLIW